MKKISIMILFLVVALASCKKTPEVNLKYVDVERDLVTVGTTTANIQCDYEYIATLKKAFFCYGEGETNMNSAEMRVVQNTLYVELVGLSENTTYSYYYEFHNGFNSMRTALKSFKTEAGNGGGEEPPTPEIVLPTVITASVTEITVNSAKSGGEVTNDGGAEVTERGICWGTNANPSLNDSHVSVGSGTGAFTALMDGLEANTTYHVRAFAINEAGTSYGLDKEFETIEGGGGNGNAPIGAINGLFTINENGDQVYFSQGNLQYQASTNTWRFAENQWNFVGGVDYRDGTIWGNVFQNGVKCDNSLASSTYDGWIDLFGWATSGYHDPTDPYNVQYQPWSISTSVFDIQHNMFGYGPSNEMPVRDLIGSSANYDWGVYNPIMNGGNTSGKWRTLSLEEWNYVFNLRSTTSGIRYAKANVANTDGVILLPDGWEKPESISIVCPGNFQTNIYNLDEWDLLEESGAVFLPIGGTRYNTDIDYSGSGSMRGAYWSVTNAYQPDNTNLAGYAYNLYLRGNAYPNCIEDQHLRGSSVRLVQDANP